jgi:hypothetical protein
MRIISIEVLVLLVGLADASAGPDAGIGVSRSVLVTPQPTAFTNFMLSLPSGFSPTNQLGLDPGILNETNAALPGLSSRPRPHYSLQILQPNRERDYCLKIGKPSEGTNYVIQVIR